MFRKKLFCVSLCFAVLTLLAACEKAPGPGPSAPQPLPAEELPQEKNPPKPEEAPQVLTLRLVEGAENGDLILAGESQVLSLSAADCELFLDGQPAAADTLEDGMPLELHYQGSFRETYPLQLGPENRPALYAYSRGSKENPGGSCYDLCGLYLQVLEDLWARDEGLNGGVQYISLDLSQAPGNLSTGEKSALAWVFASRHDAEPLELSYQELKEQGFLDEGGGWKEGLLFSISASEAEDIFSLPQLRFDAGKWRSPLGAYFFQACSVIWPEFGSWSSYQIGAEAIS